MTRISLEKTETLTDIHEQLLAAWNEPDEERARGLLIDSAYLLERFIELSGFRKGDRAK